MSDQRTDVADGDRLSSVQVSVHTDDASYESSSVPRCWTPLFGYQRVLRRRDACGVYGVDELRAILDLERRRAKRTGKENSILFFRIDRSSVLDRTIRRIVTALRAAVRETDHIGWLNENVLAVLLSDTPVEAAVAIASRLNASGRVPEVMPEVRHL